MSGRRHSSYDVFCIVLVLMFVAFEFGLQYGMYEGRILGKKEMRKQVMDHYSSIISSKDWRVLE